MLINIMNENKNNSKLDFENYKEENVKSKKSSLPGKSLFYIVNNMKVYLY